MKEHSVSVILRMSEATKLFKLSKGLEIEESEAIGEMLLAAMEGDDDILAVGPEKTEEHIYYLSPIAQEALCALCNKHGLSSNAVISRLIRGAYIRRHIGVGI